MSYLLHIDHPTNSAILHEEGCPAIGDGGRPYADGSWERIDSREEALDALERTGKKNRRPCKRCNPQVVR